jgi:FdhE protein
MTGAPSLEALARGHPEWRPWLRLYEEARRALSAPPRVSVIRDTVTPSDGAPWLADAVIAVDARWVTRLLQRLFGIAAGGGGPGATLDPGRVTREMALALLEAAVAPDAARIEAQAADLGTEPGPLGAVTAFGLMPLLHACREAPAVAPPGPWGHGHCPLCGAWPALAEERGVERTRHFRCSRCGSGWYAGWLSCPYCGNADHTRLGTLVGEGGVTRHRLDTCDVCRGYVKTLGVLRATPAAELALADLASVALDVVAVERGYRRPPGAGRAAAARVVAA